MLAILRIHGHNADPLPLGKVKTLIDCLPRLRAVCCFIDPAHRNAGIEGLRITWINHKPVNPGSSQPVVYRAPR